MSDEEKTCCCHCRTKHRDDKEERDLLNRLSRIEGQIRGIRGMVENDAYCPDILKVKGTQFPCGVWGKAPIIPPFPLHERSHLWNTIP